MKWVKKDIGKEPERLKCVQWLVTQLNRCRTLGVGLLGNVLTQEGIPRGGGIIRDLAKVFFQIPTLSWAGGGGGGFGVFVHSCIRYSQKLMFPQVTQAHSERSAYNNLFLFACIMSRQNIRVCIKNATKML